MSYQVEAFRNWSDQNATFFTTTNSTSILLTSQELSCTPLVVRVLAFNNAGSSDFSTEANISLLSSECIVVDFYNLCRSKIWIYTFEISSIIVQIRKAIILQVCNFYLVNLLMAGPVSEYVLTIR